MAVPVDAVVPLRPGTVRPGRSGRATQPGTVRPGRSGRATQPGTVPVDAVVPLRRVPAVPVMNGDSDKMVPTKNTVDLDRRLANSQLVIYPDAGHGGVFQFHEDFVKRALEFL